MQRSKFPYTARSSARVIRHAVSIDERRAKFRQDLISENRTSRRHRGHRHHGQPDRTTGGSKPNPTSTDRYRRKSTFRPTGEAHKPFNPRLSAVEEGRLDPRKSSRVRLHSPSLAASHNPMSQMDGSSVHSATSVNPFQPGLLQDNDDDDEDEMAAQDIEELWFPGCHADLGGGWPLAKGESPLSHGPLVWMVREAQRAGLDFDGDKMLRFKCCDEDYNISSQGVASDGPPMPEIQVDSPFSSPRSEKIEPGWAAGMEPQKVEPSAFEQNLYKAATKGVLHDCLKFNNGLTFGSVLSWKLMEYLPFRRMDLRPDGSWKAISFPLPMGETRDIPENARIHHSAIQRMEADERYRPGNLIIGGGGRGVRKAPKEMGIGNWEVLKGKYDPIGKVYVRKGPSLDKEMDKETNVN